VLAFSTFANQYNDEHYAARDMTVPVLDRQSGMPIRVPLGPWRAILFYDDVAYNVGSPASRVIRGQSRRGDADQ
jgi:hypothetical protein